MAINTGSVSVSATTTAQFFLLPAPCVAVWLRAPTSNTDKVTIAIGHDKTNVTGAIVLNAGEGVALDVSDRLLRRSLTNTPITSDDYINSISYTSASGTQDLLIDGFTE